MSNERAEFSRRLAAAMRNTGHEARPSVLFKQFNSHYRGRSVVFQTASRWLKGEGIPSQDKLLILASLYGVEPQVLRYGGGKSHIADRGTDWPKALGATDRSMIDAYISLSPARRKLVRELVSALVEAE